MCEMTEARKKTLAVLEDHLKGNIAAKDLVSRLPNYYEEDELLDDIINTFCEPLTHNAGVASWDEVVELTIMALKENWTTEMLDNALETGVPQKDQR